MIAKARLKSLVEKYQTAKLNGQLKNSSEATMRTWIDELLSIFDWNVQNTQQVLTEHSLGVKEKNRLRSIGSSNTRPDYTLVNGKVMLAFVDAKSLFVNIEKEKDVAFQIRSYGWSIGAPFSVVTNFEQLAIYDCSIMPNITDEPHYSRLYLFTYDEYVDKYDIINSYLHRVNVIEGNIRIISGKGNTLDEKFSKLLGEIRIDLAKAILKKNEISNINVLSYYVQTIINRILFIRVCESRTLEIDGLLKQFAQTNFWEEFKKCSYADFYNHYDGPMFKKIPPLYDLSIDNEVFNIFLSHLYYPSPYRFDVIPVKTLSDIYDLFLGYRLNLKNGEVFDELKEEFKKSNGAITTPECLVDQVVESTVSSTRLNLLSIKQIFDLKFVDIACGSGVFLVGIYDYLVKQIEKKIEKGDFIDDKFFVTSDNKILLTIEGRRFIINNCLYGVDINPEAVEVAKMSLSLKLIDNYAPKDFNLVGILGHQILKGVGANIRCGNSLVGTDFEILCPTVSNKIEELQATNAFDWESSYPEVFKHGGFDFVIGNPPYVEVKNYNVGLPHMASYVKKKYISSKNGKIDLAIPFIEKGVNLLNNKGRLGFIVQKRFFKTDYGKGIRKLLTSLNLLNGIYDYEETNLFANRITYVAILVCDKDIKNNENVWYLNSKEGENQLLSAKILTENPWNFENVHLNDLRLRLSENLGVLKDICDVKVGVQVLWNDAFQIKVERIVDDFIYGHSAIDNEVVLELDSCKPLLCNEQFAPLTKRKYSTYILFPYQVTDNGIVKELSISEYSTLFPRAGDYLKKHKDLICGNVETLPQKNKTYKANEYWHLYTRANNHGAIYEKICIPMTAKYPQASVVMDKHVYCDNANMFFIHLKENDEIRLYALAAILNSTIFNTFARSIANPQQGGYYKFNKQFLEPVPVPKKAFENCSKDIIELATVAKKIEKINEQIRNSVGLQTSGLEISLEKLWRQLDLLCNKLYGITKTKDKSILYSVYRKDRNPYGQED